MATFRKRGPYQWQAVIRRKGYPHQAATFETKPEAMAWATNIESKMIHGIWRDSGDAEKTTLAECLERYRHEVTPNKKGALQEDSKLNVLSRSTIADCFMLNIRSKDIADYRNKRLSEVAANTIRNELNLLSAIFETCRKEWGMETLHNVVKDVSRPAPGKPRDRRLQGDEEERLLAAAMKNRSPWIYPAIVIALETGMRMSEILALRWEHVNMKKQVAHLPDTKNNDVRDVPLSRRVISVLKDLLRPIDGTVIGIKTQTKTLTHTFASVCNAAGIEDMHFHDLRHEATSMFFEKGLNPMQVAAITGHKTLQMLKRYTHLRAEDLAKMLG